MDWLSILSARQLFHNGHLQSKLATVFPMLQVMLPWHLPYNVLWSHPCPYNPLCDQLSIKWNKAYWKWADGDLYTLPSAGDLWHMVVITGYYPPDQVRKIETMARGTQSPICCNQWSPPQSFNKWWKSHRQLFCHDWGSLVWRTDGRCWMTGCF